MLAGLVPYVAVSAVWNVSGHVTFTALATAYLALADRRFRAALAVVHWLAPTALPAADRE